MQEIIITTKRRIEVLDITDDVKRIVSGSGLVLIYSPHTTTSVIINEAESGLIEDLINTLSRLIPEDIDYEHNRVDRNADSHLRSMILGNSVVVPVEDGTLRLGTWQRILFVELDGPRKRRVFVKVV